ncbi:MAG: V-type ATP synthase subunit F [bacterium]
MKIGILGNKDVTAGFENLGVEVIELDSANSFQNNLEAIKQKDFGIVFITEDLAAGNEEIINKADQDVTPAFIVIPGIKGSQGIGIKKLKKTIEQAIGSDILN